jgi:superfamily II DNA or RNA helicase
MFLAQAPRVRLEFDRGTLLLRDVPPTAGLDRMGGVLWDERVGCFRAPARLTYPLLSALRRRDVRVSDSPRPVLDPPSGFRPPLLRPYQQAALDAWRVAGRRGLIVLPTGSGKTRIALAAMAATRAPILCLVPTRALLSQWCLAIADVYEGPIGRWGDGQHTVAPITVATFAGAYHHMQRLGDHFGLLVVDEAHHFGAGFRDEALEMSIAPLRLGLTATPPVPGPQTDRLATLIGPVAYELALGDLVGDALAPLDRMTWHVHLTRDERREYEALRDTYRKAFDAFMGGRPNAGWKDFLRHASRTDEGRLGIAAWRRSSRLLAYPHAKREVLALLLRRHRGQRTLVFVANNETAYAVAHEHLIMPLTCDIGTKEREAMLARFRDGRIFALVSAQVLNEGIDVPDAEVGIVVAGSLGAREHVQRVGRLLRPRPEKRAVLHELVVARTGEVHRAERRGEPLASRT